MSLASWTSSERESSVGFEVREVSSVVMFVPEQDRAPDRPERTAVTRRPSSSNSNMDGGPSPAQFFFGSQLGEGAYGRVSDGVVVVVMAAAAVVVVTVLMLMLMLMLGLMLIVDKIFRQPALRHSWKIGLKNVPPLMA